LEKVVSSDEVGLIVARSEVKWGCWQVVEIQQIVGPIVIDYVCEISS